MGHFKKNMRQTTLLFLIFLLLSCNNKTEKKTTANTVDSTLTTTQQENKQPNFYVKDKSKYDKVFLDEISKYTEPLKIIDNNILVGKDTIFFPEDLSLNEKTIFKGTKENQQYELELRRINYTTLIYDFTLRDNENNFVKSKKGEVSLSWSFILGTESSDDDETGEGYFFSEYFEVNKDYNLSIGVGFKEEGEPLRATIHLTYKNEKNIHENINNYPTLRKQK